MCYCENSFISLFICLLLVLDFPLFNTTHFYSMPSDSKLHVLFCENSNDNNPHIYRKQMEEKREKFLKQEELWDEAKKRPVHPTEHMADGPYKEKLLKINQENIRINQEMRTKHNDRIKKRRIMGS